MPMTPNSPGGIVPSVGTLRQRVVVERPDDAAGDQEQDDHGQPEEAWRTVATVWAAVEPVRGVGVWTAEQVQPQVTHQVLMRADGRDDVRANGSLWRLTHKGRVLQILSVRDVSERGRFLLLDVIEQPPTAEG